MIKKSSSGNGEGRVKIESVIFDKTGDNSQTSHGGKKNKKKKEKK